MFGNDEAGKQFNEMVAKDLPGAKLKHLPLGSQSAPQPKTVSDDIEALRLAIDALTLKLGKLRDAL
jgi:hypothetical protein